MHFSKIRDAMRWQKRQKEIVGRADAKQKKALWKRFALPVGILAIAAALFFFNTAAGWLFLSMSLLSVGLFYRKK